MLQTLPRNHSLDSDTDGSLDLGAEAGIAGDEYLTHHVSAHAPHINGKPAAGQDLQRLQSAAEEAQPAPDAMQEGAQAPSFASRMLTPFAAFALQTQSSSHTSVSHDRNGVR